MPHHMQLWLMSVWNRCVQTKLLLPFSLDIAVTVQRCTVQFLFKSLMPSMQTRLSQLVAFSQQQLFWPLRYRVFIKYCVFFENLKLFRTLAFLCFPPVSVCVHTRQVEHQRCRRTGRVQKNPEILRKNTLFNEHTVIVCGKLRKNTTFRQLAYVAFLKGQQYQKLFRIAIFQ